MNSRDLERDLYLAQRSVGDYGAAKRGSRPLARRLVRRQVQRRVVGPAMTALFGGLFR